MKQAGSVRVFLAAALVAVSIMTAKTLMPSIPLGATVVAAALGLALIFSFFRSDARRRKGTAAQAAAPQVSDSQPMDSGSIRRRLEDRPVPQVSPGPLARDQTDLSSPSQEQMPFAYATHAPASPVLELVKPDPDFETQAALAAPSEGVDIFEFTAPMAGESHAIMPPVEVLDLSDFDNWMGGEPAVETMLEAPSVVLPDPDIAPVAVSPLPEPGYPVESARSSAIVFREIFPPSADPGLSFYGGLPVTPPGFVWPRAMTEGGEIPLTFIMQWECSGLARHDATGLLPRDGALYLFMDLDWSRPMAYRLVHAEGPVDGWQEQDAPEDLGPAYGSQAIWAWPMCAGNDHDARGVVPRRLPQWAFEASHLPLAHSEEKFWQANPIVAAELVQMDGAPTEPMPADFVRPYPAYPHDWSAVRIACAYLLDLMRQPGQPAHIMQWLDETRMLYAVASRELPFEPIPQLSADEMWGWMELVRDALEPVFPNLVTAAINATLGARGNAIAAIPAELTARAAPSHKLANRPVPNHMFGTPSWVQGHLGELVDSELLLLEIGANDTLGHFFGTGVLQFTIRPEDLAARNFDRVRMTVSAG